MSMNRKEEPRWKTDPSSFFHQNTHTAFLIVCPIVIAIAVGVFAFCYSLVSEVSSAPYHADVEATLEKITEGASEKWEYIESKEEEPNPNLRATRTYKESYRVYHWKYYIDDIPHTYTSTTESGVVGDKVKMSFWSRDGEEYFRTYNSGIPYVLMFLSVVVAAAALYIIIRIIIIKIIMAKEKREKQQRRDEAIQKAPQVLNLGNFNGKRVVLRDKSGEVFEGIAEYCNKDYCEHVYGVRESSVQIANFNFFRSDIEEIIALKYQSFSGPFGKIEELNFSDGIDCIEEELFCEEDEHVYRMLLCIEDHISVKGEKCDGLSGVLKELLKTDISDRCRKKAEEILRICEGQT